MSYITNKYKDVISVENTDGTFSLTGILSKRNGCYNYIPTDDLALSAGEEYTLPISEDGVYKLDITQNSVESETIIKYYLNLQKSLLDDIEYTLCGCECTNCEDCESDCDSDLTTVLKLLSYMSLTNPQYTVPLGQVSEVLSCLLEQDISCLLVNEKITGVSDNSLILKQIISMYYLAMYFSEKNESVDDEETAYIDEKFKFNTISKCISKLGINISDVEAAVV